MLMIRLRIGSTFPACRVAPRPRSLVLYELSQPASFLGKNKGVETLILPSQTELFKAMENALTWLPCILILTRAGSVSLPVTDKKLGLSNIWSIGCGHPCERCAGLARLCKRFSASELRWI